jgi:hypothetical protein
VGTLHRQFESSRLEINRRDSRADIVRPAPIDDEAGDIAKTCTQIDRGHGTPRMQPAAEEIPNQSVAPEVSIQPLKILEVNQQLRRYRLRTIHHFDDRIVKYPRGNE